MIAHECKLDVGDFVHTIGDAHIYLNHVDQVYEQLKRTPKELPTLILNSDIEKVVDFRYEDIEVRNYNPDPPIKAPVAV
jgi:thymidylate synthase